MGLEDAGDFPRILVYAEFDIVTIFDQALQVADAYRIQVFFIVVVEEVVIIIVEEVETVENAEVVMVAVAFLVVTALTS